MGAGEIGILCRSVDAVEEMFISAQRIVQALGAPIAVGAEVVLVDPTIGIAKIDDIDHDATAMLDAARRARSAVAAGNGIDLSWTVTASASADPDLDRNADPEFANLGPLVAGALEATLQLWRAYEDNSDREAASRLSAVHHALLRARTLLTIESNIDVLAPSSGRSPQTASAAAALHDVIDRRQQIDQQRGIHADRSDMATASRRAFGELYDCHHASVYGAAFLVGGPDVAPAVTEAVFLSRWRIATGHDAADPDGDLVAAAVRSAMAERPSASGGSLASSPDPGSVRLNVAGRYICWTAVRDGLDQRQRAATALRVFGHASTRDIAAFLGVSAHTALQAVRAGRRLIRSAPAN